MLNAYISWREFC